MPMWNVALYSADISVYIYLVYFVLVNSVFTRIKYIHYTYITNL